MGFPVATIDFEASGITRLSYPIEVGISIWVDWMNQSQRGRL
jgi:hypothetical protein